MATTLRLARFANLARDLGLRAGLATLLQGYTAHGRVGRVGQDSGWPSSVHHNFMGKKPGDAEEPYRTNRMNNDSGDKCICSQRQSR
jgi:hypothetical protein